MSIKPFPPRRRGITFEAVVNAQSVVPPSAFSSGRRLPPLSFHYLFRRYGASDYGCDATREICAYTFYSDKVADVWIEISVSHLGSMLHLRDYGDEALSADVVVEAFADLIRELLRPVRVRDGFINLLGEVDGTEIKGSANGEDDDEEGLPPYTWRGLLEAPAYVYAGYGYPHDRMAQYVAELDAERDDWLNEEV
jgi:hypothetical protein